MKLRRCLVSVIAGAVLVVNPAQAQQTILSGKPRPGDAGLGVPGVAGNISGLSSGLPFCINDAPINSASGYHQMCIGANSSGQGMLTYNAVGGASPEGLT